MTDDQHAGPGDAAEGTAPPGFGGAAAPPPGFGALPPGVAAPLPPTVPPGAPAGPAAPSTMAPPAARPPASGGGPKRSLLPVLLLALVALGAIVAGVVIMTGGDDGEPGGSPEAAVRGFADATLDGDANGFCRTLSDSAREQVAEATGTSCVEYVRPRLALVQMMDPGEPEVLGSEIDGDRATVTYRWGADDDELELVAEDGEWRIDGPLEALVDPDDAEASGGAGGSAPQGTSQACETELRTVETAAEAYFAANGEWPADAQALVDADMLRELPTRAEVRAGGDVQPSGECA